MATTRRSTRPAPSDARAAKRQPTRPEAADAGAPSGRRQTTSTALTPSGRRAEAAGRAVARGRAKAPPSSAAAKPSPAPAAAKSTRGRAKAAAPATKAASAPSAPSAPKRGASRALDLEPYTAHLGRSAGAERPALPVRVLLLEAERLRKAAESYTAQLKKLPGFAAEHLRDLPALIEHLSEAEKVWGRARFAKSQSSRGALRKEAEELRSTVMNAGRYLLRRDAAAQAELARINEGEGLADLVQDLDDLAEFLEANAATFALDRRLPKKAPERARKLAGELRQIELDDGGAMRARNLAASALDFVVGEVRAAARYLFSDEPRTLAPFLSRYDALRTSRSRARRNKAKGKGEPPALTPEEA